ncbi:hypothetical protein P7C73_g4497, partial [Tremellales sp. Uapishka_1]
MSPAKSPGRVTVVLGGGELVEELVRTAASIKGRRIIFGHTSSLTIIKESTSITPYALDVADYESFLSLFQAAINRYGHIDDVFFCLEEVYPLVQGLKVATYHLRRDRRDGRRVVILSQPVSDPISQANAHGLVGMYRSTLLRFASIGVRSDLVSSTGSAESTIDAILTSTADEDTVFLVREGAQTIQQSPHKGEATGPQFVILRKRFGFIVTTGSKVLSGTIRYRALASSMSMTPAQLFKQIGRALVLLLGTGIIYGYLGSITGLLVGYLAVKVF